MAQQTKPDASEEVAGWIDGPSSNPHDPDATDPKLLRENSKIKSYQTSRFTYSGVRVFYRCHPQVSQLPTPSLPLLVFVHGLGGSVAQFHPLLTSLVHLSSCLAIDLPGCGRSKFDPSSWDAYSLDALVELLEVIIEEHRQKDVQGSVVLIGHSLGSALCARLASRSESGKTAISEHVVGLVGICPAGPLPEQKVTVFTRLLWIPGWIFDLWRMWDRRGGTESASVNRFVGPGASLQLRKMQNRFNTQSRTPVWRRIAWAALPSTFDDGGAQGGIPGRDVWAGVEAPVFLVAGQADHVTSPMEVNKIEQYLAGRASPQMGPTDEEESLPDSAAPVNVSAAPSGHLPSRIEDIQAGDFVRDRSMLNRGDSQDDPSTPLEGTATVPDQPRHPAKAFKSVIMPSPANHALLYMPSTVRILAGLISDFLQTSVTSRLSLGWQLQYLSREGKWDVKNLEKWRRVAPVSTPIGRPGAPVFRAMKTLREADDVHSPAAFVEAWGGIITNVIDISHDQPVYDPRTMEKAGINYNKFATVSKIPPTDAEVDSFVQLVDRIRTERKQKASEEGTEGDEDDVPDEKKKVIGVHCHYGFNRTGYFLVCYLVDRCGFEVQEAIDTFATARPNGIRHSHFVDRLFVRYSGLVKAKDAV